MVSIYSYNNVLDVVEYEQQKNQTIGQLLQRFFRQYQVQDELMFQPNINQVVIVDFNNQNKRIHASTTVTNAIKQNGGDLQILVVYPQSAGGAIIQYLIDGKQTYFQNFVNKSHSLSEYIEKIKKKANLKGEFEIKINGVIDDEQSSIQKKLIKNVLDQNDKVMIEINTMKINQSREFKNPQIPEINGKKKPSNEPTSSNNNLKKFQRQPQKKQGKKQDVKVEKKQEQKYELTFTFQTPYGQRSIQQFVSPSQKMIDILPPLLKLMSQAGFVFVWDLNSQQFSDKLVIYHQRSQYRALDKKFLQVMAQLNKKKLALRIRTRDEGG